MESVHNKSLMGFVFFQMLFQCYFSIDFGKLGKQKNHMLYRHLSLDIENYLQKIPFFDKVDTSVLTIFMVPKTTFKFVIILYFPILFFSFFGKLEGRLGAIQK